MGEVRGTDGQVTLSLKGEERELGIRFIRNTSNGRGEGGWADHPLPERGRTGS